MFLSLHSRLMNIWRSMNTFLFSLCKKHACGRQRKKGWMHLLTVVNQTCYFKRKFAAPNFSEFLYSQHPFVMASWKIKTTLLNENHWKMDKSIRSDEILSKVKALSWTWYCRTYTETSVTGDGPPWLFIWKGFTCLGTRQLAEIGEENPWTAPPVRMEINPLTMQRRIWALLALSSSVYKARGSFCMLSIEGHQNWQSR